MSCTRETRRCPPAVQKAGAECCRAHLRALAVYVGRLLDEHRVRYWLDFGTLLGVHRDGDVCPGDTDVDMSVIDEDRPLVEGLRDRIRAEGHDFTAQRDLTRIYLSTRNRIHVDLWYFRSERGVMQSTHHPKLDFLCENVEPIAFVDCWGYRFRVPNRVPHLLAYRYGPDFMTPQRGKKGIVWRRAHDGTNLR